MRALFPVAETGMLKNEDRFNSAAQKLFLFRKELCYRLFHVVSTESGFHAVDKKVVEENDLVIFIYNADPNR